MNRNQKIALGCGGGGCLILILIIVGVVVAIATGLIAAPGIYSPNSNSNDNYNSNSNYNRNSNYNLSSNSNSNDDGSSASSTMTEDDKHKLYQAAGTTKDSALMLRMFKKIGLGDGTGEDHQEFIKAHLPWAMKNIKFIQSIDTPEKARAYFDEHIDD